MPLVYQQNINQGTQLGLWHITEEESFFLKEVSLINKIAHPHKRAQHLAGRYLLKILQPNFPLHKIEISTKGKPYIPFHPFQFSISHCGNYAAAIISNQQRVGIDIEISQQKILALQHKFLTDKEKALFYKLPLPAMEALTMGWSIKEALFKWYHAAGVDFKKHLQILNITQTATGFMAEACVGKEEKHFLTVQITFNTPMVLCSVVS